MKKLTLLVTTALLLSAAPAGAVDLSKGFMDTDGKTPVQDVLSQDRTQTCGDKVGGPCLTLRTAVFHALLQPYDDERALSGEDKFRRGALALKLLDAKENDFTFTAQEVLTLKLVLGKLYSPIIVVQAYRMLDPAADK